MGCDGCDGCDGCKCEGCTLVSVVSEGVVKVMVSQGVVSSEGCGLTLVTVKALL